MRLDFDAAILAGDKTFLGKPCRHGHTGERFTRKDRACVMCQRIKDAARDKAHERQRKRQWESANPGRCAARYAAESREAHRARIYAWRADHPEAVALHKRISGMRRRRADCAKPTARQIRAISALQGHACAYCGATDHLHLDHIHPLAKGGTNAPGNLQFLCAWHNMSKNATPCADYRMRHDIAALTPWDVRMGLLRIAMEP